MTYTPNAGFTGRDTFDYRVADRDGQVVTATVTVDVGPPAPDAAEPRHAGPRGDEDGRQARGRRR